MVEGVGGAVRSRYSTVNEEESSTSGWREGSASEGIEGQRVQARGEPDSPSRRCFVQGHDGGNEPEPRRPRERLLEGRRDLHKDRTSLWQMLLPIFSKLHGK